jgi:intergrase/recombinase
MKIKKQYEMNEYVWIHIGDGNLHKGKVIDIFDLEHAGYSKETEFYIIEIPTEIDPLLEVRTWGQMSQDLKGPIGAYRDLKQTFPTKRFLSKVGIKIPTEERIAKTTKIETEVDKVVKLEIVDGVDIYDPTPDEVNAAIERAERQKNEMYNRVPTGEKPKRFYGKKKNETRAR